MSVGEVCKREVVFISRDSTVAEAAKLMREHHVGALVVTGYEENSCHKRRRRFGGDIYR